MGEIKQTFTGDSAKLLSEYDKLYKANVKLQETMQRGQQQSRRQHDEHMGFVGQQAASLRNMVLSYLTVEKGIEAVAGAYNLWKERLKEVAAEANKANRAIVAAAVETGQLARSGELEQFLKGIKGLTPTEASGFYRAVSGTAAPQIGEAQVQRVRGLTRAFGAVDSLFPDDASRGEFGGAVGTVSKLRPDLAPERVLGLAMTMQARAGAEWNKVGGQRVLGGILQMQEAGVDSATAEAFAVAALKVGKGRDIGKLAGLVTEGADVPGGRARTTADVEKRKLLAEFNAASPQDRMGLLGRADMAAALGMAGSPIKAGDVEALRREFAAPPTAAAAAAGRGQSRAGRIAAIEDVTEFATHERGQQSGVIDQGTQADRAFKYLQESLADSGMAGYASKRFMYSFGRLFNSLVGVDNPEMKALHGVVSAEESGRYMARELFVEGQKPNPQGGAAAVRGAIEETNKLLRDILDETRTPAPAGVPDSNERN